MANLFKVIYFLGMGLEAILRKPYVQRRRETPIAAKEVSFTERSLPAGLTLAMGLLPLIYSLTPWLTFADYRLTPTAKAGVGGIGTVFLAAAVWLFGRAHRDLGANWSPTLEIGVQHTLTTQGVYGLIRHPMYASQLVWGIGQALLLQNWVAGLGGLVMFLPMYLIRVPQEERMMLSHFGEAYEAYRARTGRILPRV